MADTHKEDVPQELLGARSSARRDSRDGVKPGQAKSVRTALVEPNALFREGLARILADTRYRVVAAVGSVGDLDSTRSTPPQLVLIGTGPSAAESAKELRRCSERFPESKRILLDHRTGHEDVRPTLESGADGYLSWTITTEALLMSLDLVMLGTTVISSAAASLLRDGAPCDFVKTLEPPQPVPEPRTIPNGSHRLSAREINTLQCLVLGDSNKLIARKFEIAEATVKVHIKAILRKIRVANRTQAAIWAMQNLGLSDGGHQSPAIKLAVDGAHSSWPTDAAERGTSRAADLAPAEQNGSGPAAGSALAS